MPAKNQGILSFTCPALFALGRFGTRNPAFTDKKKKLTSLEALEYITTVSQCAGEKRQRS